MGLKKQNIGDKGLGQMIFKRQYEQLITENNLLLFVKIFCPHFAFSFRSYVLWNK